MLPTTVTYTNAEARLEVELPELPSATCRGQGYRRNSSYLAVAQCPCRAGVGKVAFASRGVWSVKDGAHVLNLNWKAIQQEWNRAEAERREILLTTFEQVREDIEKSFRTVNCDAARTAISKIIPLLDEKAICGLRTRQPIVYSNRPRPLQHLLRSSAIEVIAEMITALNRDPTATKMIRGLVYKTNVVVFPMFVSFRRMLGLSIRINVYNRQGNLITSQTVEHEDFRVADSLGDSFELRFYITPHIYCSEILN
jgi:hypothetical protein